jgi:hypothetical protein
METNRMSPTIAHTCCLEAFSAIAEEREREVVYRVPK